MTTLPEYENLFQKALINGAVVFTFPTHYEAYLARQRLYKARRRLFKLGYDRLSISISGCRVTIWRRLI